jgi:hypothetical protein
VVALGQAFGEKDVLDLVEDAVGNLQGCERRHAAGAEAGLFAEFAACNRDGIGVGTFPGALREFHEALADGVAVLRDEIEEFAVGGCIQWDDEAGGLLVDDAVDAAFAVGALDDVLADGGPLVAIDFAAAYRLDRCAQAFFSVCQ